jgi:NADH-quinone oxidoreductase subunit E
MLRGAKHIMQHLEMRLQIRCGETTADKKVTLKKVECLGACVGAPMLQLNDREYYEHLSAEKVDEILNKLE